MHIRTLRKHNKIAIYTCYIPTVDGCEGMRRRQRTENVTLELCESGIVAIIGTSHRAWTHQRRPLAHTLINCIRIQAHWSLEEDGLGWYVNDYLYLSARYIKQWAYFIFHYRNAHKLNNNDTRAPVLEIHSCLAFSSSRIGWEKESGRAKENTRKDDETSENYY